MFNTNQLVARMKNSMFASVPNVVFDIQTGGLAIDDANLGTATIEVQKDGEGAVTSISPVINPMPISMPVPAFAFRTPAARINLGDIVVHKTGVPAFVSKKHPDGAISVIKPDGTGGKIAAVKNALFGDAGFPVVSSIMNMGTEPGGAITSNMPLMMALMGDDRGGDVGQYLAFSMMPKMMGGGEAMNMVPMLLAMNQGENIGNNSLMMLYMMMGQQAGNEDGMASSVASMLPLMLMGQDDMAGTGDMDPMMMMAMMGGMGGMGAAPEGGANPMMQMMQMQMLLKAIKGGRLGNVDYDAGGRPAIRRPSGSTLGMGRRGGPERV